MGHLCESGCQCPNTVESFPRDDGKKQIVARGGDAGERALAAMIKRAGAAGYLVSIDIPEDLRGVERLEDIPEDHPGVMWRCYVMGFDGRPMVIGVYGPTMAKMDGILRCMADAVRQLGYAVTITTPVPDDPSTLFDHPVGGG